MSRQEAANEQALDPGGGDFPEQVEGDVDLVEWYYRNGVSDGFPVVPPTPEKIARMIAAMGGETEEIECRVPPRWGNLSREVLAINLVMAGCLPEYAPVVRAAILALCETAFNLNGVQATTHMACPLLVVNGPIAREIGMNAGHNVFGSGNRANATIGRAVRMVLLNVGGGWPGELDKSTLGHPGKYSYCIAENEEDSPFAPYHVEKGFDASDSTVFVIAAEAPHSVTNHVANDPRGILDSIVSSMSSFAHNNAVSSGSCAVVLGLEHARTIAEHKWSRHDIRHYLWDNARIRFGDIAFEHRYGQVYNRSLPTWFGRELNSMNPIVPSAEDIHLFVAGGNAGRFSAFIPGWGHMTSPVLRGIDGAAPVSGPVCVDGTCYL